MTTVDLSVPVSKLEEAVEKILAGQIDDPWTKLCVATVKLGAAFAEFNNAKKAYVESKADEKVDHVHYYDRSRKVWVVKSTLGPTSLQTTHDKKPTARQLDDDYAWLDGKLRTARNARRKP